MATLFKNGSTLIVDAGSNLPARRTSQDAKGASTTTSVSATYPAATVSGNLLLASTIGKSSSTPAITGWTLASSALLNGNTDRIAIFYKIADATESVITATQATATVMKIHIYEYSNIGNPVGFDVSALTVSASAVTSLATPSFRNYNSRALIFACWGVNADVTAPSVTTLNIRQTDTAIRLMDGDLIPDALTGAVTPTMSWTTSRNCTTIVLSFLPSFPALTPGWKTTFNASAPAAQGAFDVYDYINAPVLFIASTANKVVAVFGDGLRSSTSTNSSANDRFAGFYGRNALGGVATKPAAMVFPQNTSGSTVGPRVFSNPAEPGYATRSGTDGITTSAVATYTSASAAFTSAKDVGRKITGTNIPANTTIISVTAGVATMSANATASGTGLSFSLPGLDGIYAETDIYLRSGTPGVASQKVYQCTTAGSPGTWTSRLT